MLPLKNFKAIHNIAKVMINSKKQYFIEVIPKKLKNTEITHVSIKLVDTSSFKTVSFPIMAKPFTLYVPSKSINMVNTRSAW